MCPQRMHNQLQAAGRKKNSPTKGTKREAEGSAEDSEVEKKARVEPTA